VPTIWREATLTRAKELESLFAWVLAHERGESAKMLAEGSFLRHLEAAKQAAQYKKRWLPRSTNVALIERAMSNLDAAEAQLLNFAPADYVLGQLPSLLAHVQRHLIPTDPRRQSVEQIARALLNGSRHGLLPRDLEQESDAKKIIERERGQIVTAVRAASSAALREQIRLRSFRNVLVVTALAMALLALLMALVGLFRPTLIPLCFAPEESGQTIIVCPTAQSPPLPPGLQSTTDIQRVAQQTAKPQDILVVELVGLTAAAVAAAAAIRNLRGSSDAYGLPVALAALKLPTGAITAFLGLLLIRGQFVPGLSALDTSAQILAWALVFGYAQQLLTRLVDRQGKTVLDSVRGADAASGPVASDVRAQLQQVVAQTLSEAIEGPPLVNYAGFVSVAVFDQQDDAVALTGERIPLHLGREYRLRVTIASRPQPQAINKEIAIVNGQTADEVPFDVSIDTDRLALRIRDTPLIVPADGRSASLTLPLRIDDPWPEPTLWIRVSQHGRLAQVVELLLNLDSR
jgi:hypothetical protein